MSQTINRGPRRSMSQTTNRGPQTINRGARWSMSQTTNRGPRWPMSQTINRRPRWSITYKGSGPELVRGIVKGFRSRLSVAGFSVPYWPRRFICVYVFGNFLVHKSTLEGESVTNKRSGMHGILLGCRRSRRHPSKNFGGILPGCRRNRRHPSTQLGTYNLSTSERNERDLD